MSILRVFLALSLVVVLTDQSSAATETDWQGIRLDHATYDAAQAFPDLLAIWDQRFVPRNEGAPTDWLGITLQLIVLLLGSLWVALALPRYRQQKIVQVSRAAREISRIRWTMARNPFER